VTPAWLRRLRRRRLAVAGLVVIGALVAVALLAPLLAPYDPTEIATGPPREGPSADHWFGTDSLGRDVLSRVVYGARVSLRVGLGASAIALAIGVAVGAAAGWYGRFVDALLMRVTDVFLAVPYLVFAVAIVAAVGPSENAVVLVLGLLSWMPAARLVRASVLQQRERPYVEAARAVGSGELRTLVRHVLPNAIQPVVAYAAIGVGGLVLAEASLSYLGIGVQDPTAAWGLMLHQARGSFGDDPHLLFFPGLAVLLTVMAFVVVGDALRDALDPRSAR
jgi:ABC-type dipeptide/oligopeptide/nickel transport system permease subunit